MTRAGKAVRGFAVVAAMALVPGAMQAQDGWVIAHDEGAFFTMLGNDTIVVEQFMVHGPTLEVTAVSRSPRTMTRTLRLAWSAEGTLQSHTVTVGEQTRTMDIATPAPNIPFSPPLLSPYVALARIAAAGNLSSVRMGDIPLDVTHTEGWVTFANPELGTIRVRIDGQLRAQEVDTRGSTLGGYGVRVASLDVSAWASEFAARDAAGTGLGPLSPPDTVQASVGGAQLTIAYHRPSARGRTIFGGVVPWDRVWRTGANQATGFTTDKDLVIGGTPVPAGSYTVWSLPSQEGWHLILNKQTGQWGTNYQAEHDLAHIPMRVESLPGPVEQFTIAVDDAGVLSLAWGARRGSVPIAVAH